MRGCSSGESIVHLKLSDTPDPSIAYVAHEDHFHLYLETPDILATAEELKRKGVPMTRDVHETPWGTRECTIEDNVGHTLYFSQPIE